MTWYRTDKDTGDREPVTEAQLIERVRAYYHDPDDVLRVSKTGIPIQTPFAYYRWEESNAT